LVGLFIKLGQSIGIQATILPKPYREAFSTIFDAAPYIPYSDVAKVFKQEFKGKAPLDIFEAFDETPIASASIAQVHRATLRIKGINGQPDELRQVAVKVQKPAIKKQLNLDLWSYQYVPLFLTSSPCIYTNGSVFQITQCPSLDIRESVPDTMLFHSTLCGAADPPGDGFLK
jgi:aarF domain-containing kinase